MKPFAERRQPGLPSLNQARQRRRRAIVLGRVQLREAAPRMWLWIFVVIAAFAVIYWRHAEAELNAQKASVMAKQRAVESLLGPKLVPLRDRVELWTISLSGEWVGDRVSPELTYQRLIQEPGVYLRLMLKDATSAESIRRAAETSVHDGFSACLMPNRSGYDPTKGPSCGAMADCGLGMLCNEYGVCARPGEPFNLRLAYRAMKVLSPAWSDELHRATSDLTVRAFERDLMKVSEHDVPLAIDLLTRSKLFVVVLDEEPALEARDPSAEATEESEHERVQRLPHYARIGIFDLIESEPVLLLRTQADAKILSVGDTRQQVAAETRAASQRQANNCALALAVQEVVRPPDSPTGSGEASPASGAGP